MQIAFEILEHLSADKTKLRMGVSENHIQYALARVIYQNFEFLPEVNGNEFIPLLKGQPSCVLKVLLPIQNLDELLGIILIEIVGWLSKEKITPINPASGKMGFQIEDDLDYTGTGEMENSIWLNINFSFQTEFKFQKTDVGAKWEGFNWRKI